MKYHVINGTIKRHNKVTALVALLCVLGAFTGVYVLFLTSAAPRLSLLFGAQPVQAKPQPIPDSNKLYIPKLNLSLNINSGGAEALDNGIWHRHPDRGDPEKGGNFILAGHRFSMAWTPHDVVKKSPLYNVDKLKIDDPLFVDFNGKRFEYKIAKIYDVSASSIEVEAPSPNDSHMTLYTCTLSGSSDGRLVIVARPV